MTGYLAPLSEMHFVLSAVADFDSVTSLPAYQEATPDLVDAVLTEAGKLATEVLAPINQAGDREGCRFENGIVRTPQGFAEAYRHYVESGWNALPFDPAFGGQGLPWTLAMAVQEMWQSANMSFALCPLLTQGAVELLQEHGTERQKQIYLPKLVSGEWAGTMNLTEPQAGSDVGAVKTRARRDGDHYRITGQKIFITYGDHDFTDNIIHMVLARTPDAPPGTKGISLFLVPKFLVNEDGSLGARNDLRCASIEHKLGINASPTAVMAYGDNDGALGYLIGEENQGMTCMFTMMNNARLSVGIQGLAIAERAYQQALGYARQRVQSAVVDHPAKASAPIIGHPDVRRMLMTMKAQIEAMRALAYYTATALDRAKCHPEPEQRAEAQALVDLLTPVTKGWLTDLGCEIASIGVQIHGGMGFIEETGAAQHFRDARIAPIYEGTNGIQALDLLRRKLVRDDGAAARRLFAAVRCSLDDLSDQPVEDLKALRDGLQQGLASLEEATSWLLAENKDAPAQAAAAASPYLRLFGTILGGWLLAKGAVAAQKQANKPGSNQTFLTGKSITARFYAENILPQAAALSAAVVRGSPSTLALTDDQF